MVYLPTFIHLFEIKKVKNGVSGIFFVIVNLKGKGQKGKGIREARGGSDKKK